MKVTYCDICNSVIRFGGKKYILIINEMFEDGENYNIQEALEISERVGKAKLYEMCEGCKKILQTMFESRKQTLKDVTNEIEKMIKDNVNKEKDNDQKR